MFFVILDFNIDIKVSDYLHVIAAVTKEVIYMVDKKHPHKTGPTAPRYENSGPESSDVTVAKDPTVNQTWQSYACDNSRQVPPRAPLLV